MFGYGSLSAQTSEWLFSKSKETLMFIVIMPTYAQINSVKLIFKFSFFFF